MTPPERFLAAPILELDVLTGDARGRYRLAVPGDHGYIGQSAFADAPPAGFFDTLRNGVDGALFPCTGAFANRFTPRGRAIDARQDSDVPLIVLGLRATASGLVLSAAGYLPPARFDAASRTIVSTQQAGVVASIEIELAPLACGREGFARGGAVSALTPEFWSKAAWDALDHLDGAAATIGEPPPG